MSFFESDGGAFTWSAAHVERVGKRGDEEEPSPGIGRR
jgi:hypothetical protein